MDYEMKMAEIRKKNEEKMLHEKEREREREKELIRRRREVNKNIPHKYNLLSKSKTFSSDNQIY